MPSRAQLEEQLAQTHSEGNPAKIAAALYNLGTVAQHETDYTAARLCFEECLALYRRANVS